MSNKTLLNEVLSRWLTVDAGLAPPALDCAVCTQSELKPHNRVRWADYKCCTFQPFVANFTLGAMLEDGGPPLPALDLQRAVYQPLGVMATQRFRERHTATPEEEQGEAQLCSFYNRQNRGCGIWKYRPGECSFYFCSNDVSRPQREDWSRRVFHLETAVAQMALAELGFSPREMANQVAQLNAPDADLKSLDCEELYRKAWRWAKGLQASQVLEWSGFDNASPAQ